MTAGARARAVLAGIGKHDVDILVTVGAVAVVRGVALWSAAAAWVVAGALLVAYGFGLAWIRTPAP